VLDVENLRLHYAKTVEEWLRRFEASLDRIRDMFDEPFIRAWRLYLAASTASFRVGGHQLFQIVFAREQHNEIPWTRSRHLQDEPGIGRCPVIRRR
jgi:cyclopropane-fatty-acyl-phospholipid synthase